MPPKSALHRDVAVLGTGRALPARAVSNAELEPMVKGYDKASGDFSLWVDRVTHIQERHWVDPSNETAGMLATTASRNALEAAGIEGKDLDQVIFCSFTTSNLFPGEHVRLAHDLGANCGAFLMTAACATGIWALTLADSLVRTGQCRNVLVVASECISRVTDFDDPITAILFADCAGAMVVGRKDPSRTGGIYGPTVLRTEWNADAISMRNNNCPAPANIVDGDPRKHERAMLKMEGGPRVLRNAVNRMSDVVVESLGYTPQDLKDGNPELTALLRRVKLVPHQANGRIVDGLQEKLGCPRENVYRTIYHTGNTSCATTPYTFDYGVREGNLDRIEPGEGATAMGRIVRCGDRIRTGDLVVLTSIGAGYVFGAVALEMA